MKRGKQDEILGAFRMWLTSDRAEEKEAATRSLQENGVFVRSLPDPKLITGATHAPCRVYDANGLEWKHLIWADVETGEAEQLVKDFDGKHIETHVVKLAAPLLVVPLER